MTENITFASALEGGNNLILAAQARVSLSLFRPKAVIQEKEKATYRPCKLGVMPKNAHIPTDIRREASTVMTAANASPHFDFTISNFTENSLKTKYNQILINRSINRWPSFFYNTVKWEFKNVRTEK